ncbi:MAG: hypothetical protein MI807_23755 [Verrucomicrobiales bacterium]|nr:hypothetical protein [Verrucomicrobiales bacterium]
MKTKDVFTPGKFPTVTFVSEHLEEKKRQLNDAREAGGMVISLSGPSKSGKTVFIEDTIGRDSLIHITGAGVDTSAKLWNRVFDIIGTPISSTTSTSKGFEGKFEGKVGGSAGLFVKGKGEVGASGAWASGSETVEGDAIDHLQLFIREVEGTGLVLFVDDFHYASDLARKQFAEEIKEAVRQDMTIICGSVPYHSDDVIRANTDLRGRIVVLDFDYWDPPVLKKIATSGFDELAMSVPDILIDNLAAEAAGSPQLMQALCLNLCFELGVYETSDPALVVDDDGTLLERVCRRTALMADFSTVVAMMKDGPKTRGQDRKSYKLQCGSIEDVYPIIVQAIAIDPPQLNFRYNGLTERIKAICDTEGPVGSSVTGACTHMARIANESANSVVIEWDEENDVLDVRDPYLLFFMRWS